MGIADQKALGGGTVRRNVLACSTNKFPCVVWTLAAVKCKPDEKLVLADGRLSTVD